MDHGTALFVALDCLVATLIQAGIVIWNVASGTAHAAKIAAVIPTLDTHMTALTIGANISKNGGIGLFLEFF